ncbi:cytochrome P450 4c21 [Halyomorpha halys]|uniref:cytochrome P450 4c21 n=1 Tax=Halyomorpha halys TaxID=286706 RepID=UPI0006D4E88D|nr:cytochrome P450 4c21-like [Halyomorpha halys]
MMIEMIINVALMIALAHFALGFVIWLRVRKLYSYPGLWGFPVIGNLYYCYRTLFVGSCERIRVMMLQTVKEYGRNGFCFHYAYGFRTLVVVYSPHVVKQIGFHPHLKDKPVYPYKGFRHYMNGPFSRHRSDDLWKMRRKEYNCLLRKSRVESNFYNIFLKSANKLVELMFASPSALDIHTTILGVTQSVTMETLFGLETNLAFHPRIIHYMHSIKDIASLIIANPRIARALLFILRPFDEMYIRKIGTLRRMVLREIYKNMNSNESLLTENTESYHPLPMYIASRTKKSKTFDRRVVTELQEVFITSSHTVASTMSSTITCLAVLPEIQERAWKEQYEIFGDDTREPTLEDLEQMKFLERFIKESLRFCGPPFVGKQASEDIEVDGIIIPKDTIVVYLLDFLRKDPNYWKDPEVFDPDRFLEENEGLKYSYAPFGVGVRSCPGMTFAMTEMKITLSKLLRKTKLSPVNKDLKFEDLEFEAQVLMELKNPPLLQVEERVY